MKVPVFFNTYKVKKFRIFTCRIQLQNENSLLSGGFLGYYFGKYAFS